MWALLSQLPADSALCRSAGGPLAQWSIESHFLASILDMVRHQVWWLVEVNRDKDGPKNPYGEQPPPAIARPGAEGEEAEEEEIAPMAATMGRVTAQLEANERERAALIRRQEAMSRGG